MRSNRSSPPRTAGMPCNFSVLRFGTGTAAPLTKTPSKQSTKSSQVIQKMPSSLVSNSSFSASSGYSSQSPWPSEKRPFHSVDSPPGCEGPHGLRSCTMRQVAPSASTSVHCSRLYAWPFTMPSDRTCSPPEWPTRPLSSPALKVPAPIMKFWASHCLSISHICPQGNCPSGGAPPVGDPAWVAGLNLMVVLTQLPSKPSGFLNDHCSRHPVNISHPAFQMPPSVAW
mmetsp:Transcript_5976/g.16043  ORF Transcript_5976/g.16043 Transcript_5976/m.16043 type:complete len:227 (-) Transcript_5976:868-1548(-)